MGGKSKQKAIVNYLANAYKIKNKGGVGLS